MSCRKTTKVATLVRRYSFRRGSQTDLAGGNTVRSDGAEILPSVGSSGKSTTNVGPGRGRKRKSVEIKLEPTVDDGHTDQPTASRDVSRQENGEDSSKLAGNAPIKDEIQEAGRALDGWIPPNWEKALTNIRQMRKEIAAPVDTMGCDQCHDTSTTPVIQRYQILISLMLSSQTKDQVTHAAVGRLREYGLTPENIVKTDSKILEDLIKPVGFYKRKSEYIKKASQILLDEYDGDIPDTVENLCKLPGVGPKMAHICMNCAWNVVSGIGVDVHVHRISQRMGWLPPDVIKKKKKLTPEDTREGLESWLPKSLWSEVNHLLVGFGQTICKPVGPSCNTCLNGSFCPSAKLKW